MDKVSQKIFQRLYDLHDLYDESPEHMICAHAADHIKKLSEELERLKSSHNNESYMEGVKYAIYEIFKEADVPGSREIRVSGDTDDGMCARAAEKIRAELTIAPGSDTAKVYLEAYQGLLQKSMNLNQELIKKLKAAPENEPLEMSPKHKAALTELVEMMNEDENKPLTLDELRKMQKQYVWIVDSNPNMTFSGWAVCDNEAVYYLYFNKDCPIGSASIDLDDGYGKTWIAYRHKPEGSGKA